MVSVAGANTSAPPSPTMTVWVWGLANVVVVVAPDIVVVDVAWGRVVVDVARRTVVVVIASAQLPAAQLSQQLGIVPTHAEPPIGRSALGRARFHHALRAAFGRRPA